MLHEWMKQWFTWSLEWGYAGVFVMMALESTIVPIPSEIIMPPAAYWAEQGRFSMAGIVAAGGLGSTFGSSLCYWLTRTLGRVLIDRWGRWFLLPPARMELAERWLEQYALGGVFLARLLPVVRHLIGFPAGLIRVPFVPFMLVTLTGSTLWCGVLALFGARTIGRRPDLLEDPTALASVIKHDLVWFVALVVVVGGGWLFVKWFQSRKTQPES